MVLERGEKIGQKSLGPEDIVVSEYNNGSLDALDALDHLKPLVGFRSGENLEMVKMEILADGFDDVGSGRYDEHGPG